MLLNYLKKIGYDEFNFSVGERRKFFSKWSNTDDLIRKLRNEITDKRFKAMVHMRYKKHNYSKQVAIIIRSTFDITELMLWEIANSSVDNFTQTEEKSSLELLYDSNNLILESISELIEQTNINIQKNHIFHNNYLSDAIYEYSV